MRIGLGCGLGISRAPVAAAAWSPLDLGTSVLRVFLLADSANLDAANVGTWTDLSTLNHHAIQATANRKPSRNATDADYGGKGSVTFVDNGGGDFENLKCAAVSGVDAQPYTVFAVGKSSTVGGAYSTLVTGGTGDFSELHNIGRNVDDDVPYMYAGSAQVMNASGLLATSPRIYCAEYNGASSKLFVSSLTHTATGDAGSVPFTGYLLGCAPNEGGQAWNGTIRAFLVCAGLLSSENRARVIQYLSADSGIELV